MDSDSYFRDVEAHLCRRNAGHLVRVAGPAFEMVAGWAAKGIPLKVVLRGIDRSVERRDAKGPSRRPLRIEFCEADVLDAFDEWRRAVGVGTAGGGGVPQSGSSDGAGEEPRAKPGHSLRAHLDRVVTRLTDRVASGSLPADLERAAERVIDALGEERSASRSLRGEARAAFIRKLQQIDDQLLVSARAATPEQVLTALRADAEQELAGFRGRMPAGQYARAVEAATTKLLRDRLALPDITFGS